MVQITIRQGQGYISNVPYEAEEALRNATSFRAAGYQFTWQYRNTGWDGWTKLMKHGKFPAGLLTKITKALQAMGVEYEVALDESDETPKPDIDIELEGIESRWYQDEAVEAALLNPRGVIRAPTGSGKTAIGARVIQVRGKNALVIVPTIDLLYQYREFLEAHLRGPGGAEIEIGQLGDGVVDPKPVTVATIRTAAKAVNVAYKSYEYGEYDDKDDTDLKHYELREWVESIDTLIVDEAHILGAETVYEVVTKLPAHNKYGMSASPWRDDGADLMIEAAVGPTIYRIDTEALVRDGFLVPPIIRCVDTSDWWQPAAWQSGNMRLGIKSQFQDAYKHEIVENEVRNAKIAAIVNELTQPTLVLVKQVKHGKLLQSLIPGSKFLSGKNPGAERSQVYEELRSGELRVIIATTIADMGLDLPILGALVLAGGGKSSTRHLQRIGRIARPYPGKDSALVIDFDDSHVHKWFSDHWDRRRKIEQAEWKSSAVWI